MWIKNEEFCICGFYAKIPKSVSLNQQNCQKNLMNSENYGCCLLRVYVINYNVLDYYFQI